MKSLLLAFQFLTIIPIRIKQIDNKKMAWGMFWFPVVGLFIGLVLVGANHILSFLNIEQFISAIILIVLLVFFTGGIHLDGVADTADALLSRKNKEEMLKIMRDPHIGVMGVVGIICVLLLKISFLSSINSSIRPLSLILMCSLSRWAMVFLMYVFPYARNEGKAKVFIEGVNMKIFIFATIAVLLVSVFAGKLIGLIAFVIVLISIYIIGKLISKKLGGITGDVLGAVNELTEIIVLFIICVLARTNI